MILSNPRTSRSHGPDSNYLIRSNGRILWMEAPTTPMQRTPGSMPCEGKLRMGLSRPVTMGHPGIEPFNRQPPSTFWFRLWIRAICYHHTRICRWITGCSWLPNSALHPRISKASRPSSAKHRTSAVQGAMDCRQISSSGMAQAGCVPSAITRRRSTRF
jgi:hypothetical protein